MSKHSRKSPAYRKNTSYRKNASQRNGTSYRKSTSHGKKNAYSKSRTQQERRRQMRLHSNTFILLFVIIVVVLAVVISASVSHKRKTASVNEDVVAVSEFVMEYEPLVDRYAAKYDITAYKEYLLAIIEVETGGYGSNDIMQSSESVGLPMDSLSEEASVEQGCAYFAACLSEAKEQGCDLQTVIQSYNYGKGFVSYVAEHGGEYSFELAEAFAKEQSGGKTVEYSAEVAVEQNGGWRYQYGNMFYVPLVEQYVSIIREVE